jgi:uncharacterized protein YjbI with pentapeptide repeats
MDPTVESALIGAAAALIGVGGTVIVATTGARNTRRTNQATVDAAHADAQLTLGAAVEAQFADRYSRALEQVGSANVDVRVGGIYALEGIALDSPRHHPTVMEVLTAFVREHSRKSPDGASPERWPLPDVQAALTVVGRRKSEHDILPMDLVDADLTHANLRNADLTSADLRGAILVAADLYSANLTQVDLTGAKVLGADLRSASLNAALLAAADFTGAVLIRANLSEAVLISANFSRANLRNADLTSADLFDVNLAEADLSNADLSRANLGTPDFTHANLRNADLRSAGFTNVDLSRADLTGALWPDTDPMPPGWKLGDDGRLTRDTGTQP